MAFKIAFFKGKGKTWNSKLGGAIIRWWENGPYSHCELVFSDGVWAGAVAFNGVVLRPRSVDPADWDFIDLPAGKEEDARKWFKEHEGKSYDYIGLGRFVFDFFRASRDKWFCSRACADALGVIDGWREGPNSLYSTVKFAESM